MSASQISIAAVGDIGIIGKLRDLHDTSGPSAIYGEVKKVLLSADLTIGNLEIPFTTLDESAAGRNTTSGMVSRPRHAIGLKEAGFNVLTLANNHMMDWGAEGLETTLRALSEQGILYAGAGLDAAAANAPVEMRVRGVQVVIFSRTQVAYQFADERTAGVARLVLPDLLKSISLARETADCVVVSVHWGLNYSDIPSPEIQAIARRCFEAGANVVIGHHPHIVQGIEASDRRLCAYSLGDFIFDPCCGEVVASDMLGKRRQTMILQISASTTGVDRHAILPVTLSPETCVPRLAPTEEAHSIRERVDALSQPLIGDGITWSQYLGNVGESYVSHELAVLANLLRKRRFWHVAWLLSRIRWRHVRILSSGMAARLRRLAKKVGISHVRPKEL